MVGIFVEQHALTGQAAPPAAAAMRDGVGSFDSGRIIACDITRADQLLDAALAVEQVDRDRVLARPIGLVVPEPQQAIEPFEIVGEIGQLIFVASRIDREVLRVGALPDVVGGLRGRGEQGKTGRQRGKNSEHGK